MNKYSKQKLNKRNACGGKLLVAVTGERRYGPSRLYALTANKNTAKQTNRVSATFDINNTTSCKATIVLNFESLLISPDPTYLVDCLTDYSRTGIAV